MLSASSCMCAGMPVEGVVGTDSPSPPSPQQQQQLLHGVMGIVAEQDRQQQQGRQEGAADAAAGARLQQLAFTSKDAARYSHSSLPSHPAEAVSRQVEPAGRSCVGVGAGSGVEGGGRGDAAAPPPWQAKARAGPSLRFRGYKPHPAKILAQIRQAGQAGPGPGGPGVAGGGRGAGRAGYVAPAKQEVPRVEAAQTDYSPARDQGQRVQGGSGRVGALGTGRLGCWAGGWLGKGWWSPCVWHDVGVGRSKLQEHVIFPRPTPRPLVYSPTCLNSCPHTHELTHPPA